MADAFLTAEAGTETSRPREFFEIVQDDTVTYRVASGTRDIVYNGNVYTAQPVARTETTVDTVTGQQQTTFALPLAHPLVQRYFSQGSPPRQVLITGYRRQLDVGDERFFGAIVTGVAVDKHIAKFSTESRFARLTRRQLPLLRAGKLCQHVLYDANCRFPRNLGTIGDDGTPLTITGFNGRTVTISDIGGELDHWADNGELVHLATGERMTILQQIGTIITMQMPIPGIRIGDVVTVSAGCAHDIVTCRTKFANQVNFGGFPQLPTKNPFTPTGLGVVEQE